MTIAFASASLASLAIEVNGGSIRLPSPYFHCGVQTARLLLGQAPGARPTTRQSSRRSCHRASGTPWHIGRRLVQPGLRRGPN
jgi:hypothetical protein